MTGLGDTVSEKYRLERVLGEGGMGTVFEASHKLLGKKVAIKLLRPEFTSQPVEVERFYREAQAAASLGHRGIAEVHDVGWTEDGLPYMVMELLRGETLAQLLERLGGRLEPDLAVHLCEEILSALIRVHRAGVIHRDLKPSNLFVARDEDGGKQLKILDFGISKITVDAADHALTQDGAIMGTPWYMSPEQARGDSDVDHRTDLWAVGAILYEALTGQRPFQGLNFRQICFNIISTPPTAPTLLRPEVSPALEGVVLASMRKERDERYQNAQSFLDDLRRAAASSHANRRPLSQGVAESNPFDDDLPTRVVPDAPLHRSEATQQAITTELESTPAVPETVVITAPSSGQVDPSGAAWPTDRAPSATPGAKPADTFAAVVNEEAQGPQSRRGLIALLVTAGLIVVIALVVGLGFALLNEADDANPSETPAAGEPTTLVSNAQDRAVAATGPVPPTPLPASPPEISTSPQPAAPTPAPTEEDSGPSEATTDASPSEATTDAEPVAPAPEPLTPEEIEAPLEDLATEVRRCARPSLRRSINLEISLSIAGDGTAEMLTTTPSLPSRATTCLRRLVASTTFRPTGAEPVNATHLYRIVRRRPARSRGARPRPHEHSDLRDNPFGGY